MEFQGFIIYFAISTVDWNQLLRKDEEVATVEFVINPYIGAGKISLGMTSAAIQEILESHPEKFRKSKNDDFETDAYKWCHIYFEKPGVCNAIEFFSPASVIFNGHNLLGNSYAEVREFVLQYDNTLQFDETGFTSIKYGFGVYAPFAEEEPSEPVEGVIVFEKGYYD